MSNAELLALLIPRGTTCPESGELLTRLDLARSLLSTRGSLEGILTADPRPLAKHPGIGWSTAGAITSAGVLTGRLEAEQAGKEQLQISCPEDVADAYGPELRNRDQEVFMALALSASNCVIDEAVIHRGGLMASVVDPKTVYSFALQAGAAALLVLHNHPSTNPEPSRADVKITRKLAQGGNALDLPLHDHVIVGGRDFSSLAERGVL